MEKQEIIVRLAKVTEIGADGQATLTFYGDTGPSEKQYPYIRNYVPKKDDTVVLLKQGDSYIILGAAIRSEVVIEYAAADHNHDEKYAPANQKFTHLYSENEKYGVWVTDGGYVVPLKSESLGSDSRQWENGYFKNVYINGTAVSTSDKRKKKFIKSLPEKFTEFFMKLRPVTFKYKNGTSGRSHVGFIAQEVEQAMTDAGITREDFGGLVVQENGQYGLRYEEFIAVQTRMIQDLCQKVEKLERKVEQFEK